MLRRPTLLMLLCLGCGTSQAGQAPRVEAAPVTTAPAPRDRFASNASFAELVRSAAALESTPRATRDCLFEAQGSELVLRAELGSALRPLPQPNDDLDEALKNAPHVELLGSWGRYGDGNGKLAFASFTESAPSKRALALVVTDRGIALRSPSGSDVPPVEGLDVAHALSTLASADPRGAATLFVSAEAGIRLAELVTLLTAISPTGRQVVLAVNLAPSTTLPLPASAGAKVARCTDGLSATDAREGSLPLAALKAGLEPLQERAPDCLTRGDARGAAGGRIELALRIGESGRIQEACILRSETDDPGVDGCVIGVAGQLMFSAPSPGGVIDLQLPIALQASPHAVMKSVCGPP